MNFVSGAWLALVDAAHRGLAYPPLFADGWFGGTRYMPLTVAVTTGVDGVVDDPLLAGKLVTYLACIALAALMFAALRSAGVSLGLRLLLLGVVAVSLPAVTLGVRGDVPSVALQLAAVLTVARSESRRSVGLAGVLVGLAFLAKLNALWALAAIVAWLVVRARHRLLPFFGSAAATVVAGVVATQLWSHGRFLDNIRELGFAGSESTQTMLRYATGIAGSPQWRLLVYLGAAGAVLVTLAVLRFALAAGERSLTLYDVCLPFVVATTLLTLLDGGATENHLLDLIVVASICTGLLTAADRSPSAVGGHSFELAVVVLLGWTTLVGFQSTLRGDAVDALRGRADGDSTARLVALAGSGSVLSEDPTIPVLRGERPVVLDPFMLRRIGEQHPEWIATLVDRIDRRTFDRVLLTRKLGDSTLAWYRDVNLGSAVAAAIDRSYRYTGSDQGNDVAIYVPRER